MNNESVIRFVSCFLQFFVATTPFFLNGSIGDRHIMDQARITVRDDIHLSPLHESDTPELVCLLNERSIYDNTLRIPFPYTADDAEFFLNLIHETTTRHGHPLHFAIRDESGRLIGGCGFEGLTYGHRAEIGYWLGKPYWGCGLMTEAAEAVVADHFAHNHSPITSAYLPGNTASCNILTKLGFCNSHLKSAVSRPLDRDVALQGMTLTLDHWQAARPLRVETDRLVIRPFAKGDLDRFLAIAGLAQVARMMTSIPHPLEPETARNWIGSRQFRGQVPFCAAIAEKGGPLVGVVGIGGEPVSTMYFIDPDCWGRGYATEAMQGFLTPVLDRFGLDAIIAGANADNPASHRVLIKLGFSETHREDQQSATRLEPDPVIMYRLSRT